MKLYKLDISNFLQHFSTSILSLLFKMGLKSPPTIHSPSSTTLFTNQKTLKAPLFSSVTGRINVHKLVSNTFSLCINSHITSPSKTIVKTKQVFPPQSNNTTWCTFYPKLRPLYLNKMFKNYILKLAMTKFLVLNILFSEIIYIDYQIKSSMKF